MADEPDPLLYAQTGAAAAAPTPTGPAASTDRPVGIDAVTGAVSAGPTPDGGGGMSLPVLNADDFEVVHKLGAGGMGVVTLARHIRSRKWFALKGLPAHLINDPHARRRFDQEATVLFGLKHAYITVCFGQIPTPDDPRLVLEYVQGPTSADPARWPDWLPNWPNPSITLDDFVRANGPMPFSRVADLGVKLGSALLAAHEYGIMHRDVKPLNVLLDKNGDPILSDFGLARAIDPTQVRLTGSLDNMGTPIYAAPELYSDPRSAGAAVDQYSLALTLYFAATGEEPTLLRPDKLPPKFMAWLATATSRNPDDRFKDMAALTTALRLLKPAAPVQAASVQPARVVFSGPTVICPNPVCATQSPESDRRCRKCNTDLWTTCLQCGIEMPGGREVCPKCNCIQGPERERRLAEINTAIDFATTARENFQYQQAVELLSGVTEPAHPLLADAIGQANALAGELRAEQKKWQDMAGSLGRQVWTDYAVGQCASIAPTFKQLRQPLWSRRMVRMAIEAGEVAKQFPVVHTAISKLTSAYDVKQVNAPIAIAETRFKFTSKLIRYAKAIPHHELDDLAEKVEVTAVRMYVTHFAELHTLYESRKVVLVDKPDRGSVAQPVNAHTDTDPWGADVPVPQTIKNGNDSHVLSGYFTIYDCSRCQAAGDIVCTGCKGAKQVTCPTCRGAKTINCKSCDSRGRRERKRSITRYRDCNSCRGTGGLDRDRCRRCDGTGREQYEASETFSVPCDDCMERGKLHCPDCHAAGVVKCEKCKAVGRESCPQCEGTRRVRQSATVQQTFKVEVFRSAKAANKEIPEVLFKQLTDADYQQIDQYTTPPGVTLMAALGNTSQGKNFGRWLSELVAATPRPAADARVARQQLVLHRAEVAQVEYSYDGNTYVCWLTSSGDVVLFDESPVTTELRRMIKKPLKAGNQRALALAVADARDMARADEGCAEVFEELKPDIGKDVLEWSKAVWTFEQRNLIWGGVGAIAAGFLVIVVCLAARWWFGLILGLAFIGTGVFCISYSGSKKRT